jgi:hypothetical protein
VPSANGTVSFTWTASTDAKTPQAALRYNVYVRQKDVSNAPVLAVWPADIATGFLKVNPGEAFITATSYTITGLANNAAYEWGVQAINHAKQASAFTTGTFTLGTPATAVDKNNALGMITAYKKGETLLISTDIANEAELAVYDVAGNKLWARKGVFAGETEVSGLQQGGVYIVVIRVGSSVQTTKAAF